MLEIFSIGKLGEGHTKELIEAGKRFHMIIVMVPIKELVHGWKAINCENTNCPEYMGHIVQMISRDYGQKPISRSVKKFVVRTARHSDWLNSLNAISPGQELHLAI